MTSSLSMATRESLARQYLEERAKRSPKLTPSRTITNATTQGSYTGNRMPSVRPGADDHLTIQSRGF